MNENKRDFRYLGKDWKKERESKSEKRGADRQKDRLTERQADRNGDRNRDRQTDRDSDRQTAGQTKREREKIKEHQNLLPQKKILKMDAKSGRFFALNCDIPAPLPSSKFFCLQQTAPS